MTPRQIYIIAHVHSDPVQIGKIARMVYENAIPNLYPDEAAAKTGLENYGLWGSRYRVWCVTLTDEPINDSSVKVA